MNADNLRINIKVDTAEIQKKLDAALLEAQERELYLSMIRGVYSSEPPRLSIPKKETAPGKEPDGYIESIAVGPLVYRVYLVDELPKGKDGLLVSDTCDEQQTIKILKTLASGQRRICLYYEALQTIYRMAGGRNGDLAGGQWQALAAGVLEALQRNTWEEGKPTSPDSVTIGPMLYKIAHIFELKGSDGEGRDGERINGLVNADQTIIELDSELSPQARRAVLWECILRAILVHAGCARRPWATDPILKALSYGIVRLLRFGRIDTRL